MLEKGYFDCYVLFSGYHIEYYDEFKDFAERNLEKLTRYITTILSTV